MKNLTDYVVEDNGKFYVDSTDIDTGEQLTEPGDSITFEHKGKMYLASVSRKAVGRDDDMYLLADVTLTE